MSRLAAFIVLLSAVALTGTAQSPSVVRGRVLAADGSPLHNVRVQVGTDPARSTAAPVFTDADGRFAIPDPAGVSLSITKAGFVRATAAAASAGEVRLVRAGAMSGRILDVDGEPLTGMTVEAYRLKDGIAADEAADGSAIVDDLGNFRVGGLAEGRYRISVVSVSPVIMPGGQTFSVPGGPRVRISTTVNGQTIDSDDYLKSTRTFYPGVAEENDAQAVGVAAGEERESVDFVAGREPIVVFPLLGPDRRRAPDVTWRGSIEGQVIGPDGRGVSQVVVRIESDDYPAVLPAVVTDSAGRYRFNRLPAGNYRIATTKLAFVDGWWAEQQPNEFGDSIELAVNQALKNVDIRIARSSAVEGRLVDERGDPVEGAAIQIFEARYVNGRRELVDAGGGGTRRTDDRGWYRVYGLGPGRYLVRATVGQINMLRNFQSVSDLSGYAPTYFPGAALPADAQVLALGLGQQYTGADFGLLTAPTAHISGRILSPTGQTGGRLVLSPRTGSSALGGEKVGARMFPDGTFEFPNVAPGEYVIQSYAGRTQPFKEGEFGFRLVTVTGTDVDGVIVQRAVGSTVTGRFVDDDDDQTVAHAGGLTAVPVDPDRSPDQAPASARFLDQLSFEMQGLSGPRVFRVVTPNAGWMLKAIRLNGRDVTDTPIEFGSARRSIANLEVVMTRNVTEVAGTVTDAGGRPVPHAAVVVFATNRDLWGPLTRYLAEARTDKAGAFSILRLPPGDYLAAAVAGARNGDLQDPARLEALSVTAAPVRIDEGQRVPVALRVSR